MSELIKSLDTKYFPEGNLGLEPPEDIVNLPGVSEFVISRLVKVRKEGIEKIVYVAGIIGSDGPEHEDFNRAQLKMRAAELRSESSTRFVFTSPDIFTPGLFQRLRESQLERREKRIHLIEFWRGIFRSGEINDLILTQGWRRSEGAIDEFKTATSLGINILDEDKGSTAERTIVFP